MSSRSRRRRHSSCWGRSPAECRRAFRRSSTSSVLRQAVDSVGPLGTCGIIGAPRPDAEVALNVLDFIIKGIRLVGINQGDAVPRESIPALVRLHQQGRFPFDELVRFYDFADI